MKTLPAFFLARRVLAPAALAAALALAAGCGSDNPTAPRNRAPRVERIVTTPSSVVRGGEARVVALAGDPDGDPITVRWTATGGTFSDTTATSTTWTAPDTAGLYVLSVTVRDAELAVTDTVSIAVGNASVTVLSDPPGAFILIDGVDTAVRAPHTFEPLAPGFHGFNVSEADFLYEPGETTLELAEGTVDTVRFAVAQARADLLDLGRDDLLEVGGVVFLPAGTGYLYAARTPDGTGIFNSPVSPRRGEPNGVRLLSGVRVEEPLALAPGGTRLFYVGEDDTLRSASVFDFNADGRVDSVGAAVAATGRSAYGPAVNEFGELAFSSTPSADPAAVPLLWSESADGILTDIRIATSSVGKLPTWEPGGTAAWPSSGTACSSMPGCWREAPRPPTPWSRTGTTPLPPGGGGAGT